MTGQIRALCVALSYCHIASDSDAANKPCHHGHTCCRGALTLVAGGAQLEAAHLQHLAAALARGVQADALKGALALHRSLRWVWVVVPGHGKTWFSLIHSSIVSE